MHSRLVLLSLDELALLPCLPPYLPVGSITLLITHIYAQATTYTRLSLMHALWGCVDTHQASKLLAFHADASLHSHTPVHLFARVRSDPRTGAPAAIRISS